MSGDTAPGSIHGSWQITAEDVALVARGARVLGSGGGGNLYLGQLLAVNAVRGGRSIAVIPPENLDDDAFVIAVAQIGTTTVFAERLARGGDIDRAFTTMERYAGKRATAVMCYEIGGVNSMLPLVVAAQRGLPVVDADLMGRAFPEFQMTTLDIYGAPSSPIALCDDRGNVTIVAATEDMFWTERLARALTLAMGGLAYVARPVLHAVDIKRMAVSGSYSRAHAIGKALQRASDNGASVEVALIAQGGRTVLRGRIIGIERHVLGQVGRGSVAVQDLTDAVAGPSSIEFQNEYLMVRRDAKTVATTPDALCVIDEETGAVVDIETLHAGLHVVVIAFPADLKLITPAALHIVGPAAFGYDTLFTPHHGLINRRNSLSSQHS
jgi:DUF917 family protein